MRPRLVKRMASSMTPYELSSLLTDTIYAIIVSEETEESVKLGAKAVLDQITLLHEHNCRVLITANKEKNNG